MEFLTDKLALIGNKGKGIRSDCHVTMELTAEGGIQLELISKVESMYGNDIRKLLHEISRFLRIQKCKTYWLRTPERFPLLSLPGWKPQSRQLYRF